MSGWIPLSSATDDDAIHDNVAGEIDAITEKTTPDDADLVIIEDSADSFAKKKVELGNLPSGGGGGANVPAWITHLAERMPDETGHADDDFFDDGDHSGWTKTTVSGNATWEELDGILSVRFDSQTAGDVAAALLPLTSPSAPVTLEVAVTAITALADNYTFGVGFTDGTASTDDCALFRYGSSGTPLVLVQGAGTLTAMTTVSNNLGDFWVTGGLLYLRIVWTTTNTFETQVSSNGRNWRTIGSSFSRTMTPTHAMLFGSAHGGAGANDAGVASFHYLRRNDVDPT